MCAHHLTGARSSARLLPQAPGHDGCHVNRRGVQQRNAVSHPYRAFGASALLQRQPDLGAQIFRLGAARVAVQVSFDKFMGPNLYDP